MKPLDEAVTSEPTKQPAPLSGVQYCYSCSLHHKRQTGIDTMFYGCLAGLGLGVLTGKLWLAAVAGLMYYLWMNDHEQTRHGSLNCTAAGPAVRYRGQEASRLLLEFDNKSYLDAFLAANPQDRHTEVVLKP